jgi:hypothetical protein
MRDTWDVKGGVKVSNLDGAGGDHFLAGLAVFL